MNEDELFAVFVDCVESLANGYRMGLIISPMWGACDDLELAFLDVLCVLQEDEDAA